jgi:hypothetical protein
MIFLLFQRTIVTFYLDITRNGNNYSDNKVTIVGFMLQNGPSNKQ